MTERLFCPVCRSATCLRYGRCRQKRKSPYQPGQDFNARTCITAEQLRSIGLEIPESIPGCAWISRSSIQIGPGVASHDKETLSCTSPVSFTEDFKWVEIDVTIPPS